MVPTSNGHRRRLPTNQHKTIEFPPTTGGSQGPCRDAGVGAIAPGFAMLKKASALHTLIRQRHLTPSCGEHAPTAERTLNPARMFVEGLDRRPGIREQPGSKAAPTSSKSDFRSSPKNVLKSIIAVGPFRAKFGSERPSFYQLVGTQQKRFRD